MNGASATFTLTIPWWAYGAFCTGILGLVAGGYAAGRADRADARRTADIDTEYAPTLDRWRHLDRNNSGADATVWPVNSPASTPVVLPGWAVALDELTQVPAPTPILDTAAPLASTVGRAPAPGEPLTWFEEVSALRVALGHGRYTAELEKTTFLPGVAS